MVSLEVQFAVVRRIPEGARVLGESGSQWGVIEASTVRLPSVAVGIGDWSRHGHVERLPLQGGWRAILALTGDLEWRG